MTATTAAMTAVVLFFLSLFASPIAGELPLNLSGYHSFDGSSSSPTLCSLLIQPAGYPCSEHTAETDDGFLLALQRVSSNTRNLRQNPGPPVLLLHGLFVAGDSWFLNCPEESLGFILADQGFDVWVGNVRGTRWSQGHVSLSVKDKDFWDWSWQELALYDVAAMLRCVNSVTNSKVFVVGHSQGTLISLAAFTQRDIAEMVEAVGLLSPVVYLGHISSVFVLSMVDLHFDQLLLAMFHQINLRSDWCVYLLYSVCESPVDCNDLLSDITGKNCCLNKSRVDFYFEYEPHPTSAKNFNHLFQMVRKGSFSKYDYGAFKNLLHYGHFKPPEFQIGDIPKSLPIWIAYGGNDALADVTDVEHLIKELKSTPDLVFLENYGHVDFIISVNAKEDMFDSLISFLKSRGKTSSLK